MIPQTPRRARRLALVLVGALAIAGCATRAEEPAPAAPADAFPLTLTAPDGKPLTLAAKPERIVSLSASATENLFAVGAGKQVVAVDNQSTFPADAPKTTLSGLTPNVEAIAGHTPNLVIASGDAGDLVAGLGKLGIPVLILPAAKNLDDVYAQLDLVGKATGHAAEGADVARRTKEDIEKIVRDTPKPGKPLSYYHELDTDLYSVTSKTFIGQVYGLFGLTNVADAADTDASGYPKLSAEYLIKANPSLIFLGDTKCCGQTAQTVALRPGWNTIDAVTGNRVVALDDDIASRWGPRVVDLVRAVADAVAAAK
ncbi:ABC transporter substrate-binding protein [Actinokineospora xionganensis]|uniref:ABC transporter substrate-binding protein n=1 Tax=Actinokineospora xionganensis TaxID=2684470 RepID=A0ABR7L569_9PSEU|nr:ABC transporter substrate-binding protein [Actinokineospora xionganensis]MBC6447789.1 ABC transporter substrate-binding protein [Actinokineospora xionganensis]